MTEVEISVHTGHCLCGSVAYSVSGDPVIVAHCHCDDCQRLTGAGHSTGAMYPSSQLSILGVTAEYKLTSDNGNQVTRVFCPSCGSPILGKNTGMEGFVTLSLGTMDDSNSFEPGVTVFCRNQNSWDKMDEAIPSFDTQPVFDPSDA
ncbi:MAG: hypothetical protein ACJAXW_002690 [Candidatus Azotimanducaceae bacterium]|jgi:hypothetical protein